MAQYSKSRISSSLVLALAASGLLGACAGPRGVSRPAAPVAQGNSPAYTQYGRVQSVDLVRAQAQTSGGGALLGGVIGAVVGRQIGSGSGRTAGTAVGAVGGAVIGNEIEKNRGGAQDVYRVSVYFENGSQRSFDYAQPVDLRPGDRVRAEGEQLYRY